MTLATNMYVHDEVDVHALFHELRRLLGATDEHPFTDEPSKLGPDRDGGGWTIGNRCGIGLPAWSMIHYRPGEPLRKTADECTDYCWTDPDGEDEHHHPPAMWCQVWMDTAYSYNGPEGGCGALHARLVFELGQWLDERGVTWSWVHEYDGSVHGGDDRYADLRLLVEGGQRAMRWFKGVVEPAIPAIAAEVAATTGNERAT